MTLNEYDVIAGKRLREIRRQRNVTQTKLAKALGVSFQQVQKYETGSNRISFSRLVHICIALDVPPTYFFADLVVMDQGMIRSTDEGEMLTSYRLLPEVKRTAVRDFLATM